MAESRHPFVSLAVEAIQAFVREQRVLDPGEGLFAEIPDAHRPAGAFVSLKRAGELRGCIGTVEPTKGSLIAEIIHNAISAATRDPRFPAVQASELNDLVVSVDVLSAPQPVLDFSELNHRRYGLVVRSGGRQGVLLPDIEGINSEGEQLAVVRQKAGITQADAADLFRFEVVRYR